MQNMIGSDCHADQCYNQKWWMSCSSNHWKQHKAGLITMELVMKYIVECFSYECPKSVCKNIHFITCNKSSIYRCRHICKISSNSNSFSPPLHLLTATRWCGDLNLKLICRLLVVLWTLFAKMNLACNFELRLLFGPLGFHIPEGIIVL